MTNTAARKSQLDVLEKLLEATEEVSSSTVGLTDEELRSSPVVVSGPLTDMELRDNPVPVTVVQGSTMTATISFGQFLSEPLDLGLMRLGRIDMPDSWDAANLSLRTSSDNSAWKTLYNQDGTEYTITTQGDSSVLVNLADMLSLRYVQLCSGSPTSPVTQTDDRVITLALVP